MIGPVSPNLMPPSGGVPRENELTAEQKGQISSILESYDSAQLTESDASAIVSSIQELGITPGAGLAEAMADAGFDAREVGDLAGVGGAKRGGPMTQSVSSDAQAALSTLQSLLENYDISSMTSEDWSSVRTEMESLGFGTGGRLFDITV